MNSQPNRTAQSIDNVNICNLPIVLKNDPKKNARARLTDPKVTRKCLDQQLRFPRRLCKWRSLHFRVENVNANQTTEIHLTGHSVTRYERRNNA